MHWKALIVIFGLCPALVGFGCAITWNLESSWPEASHFKRDLLLGGAVACFAATTCLVGLVIAHWLGCDLSSTQSTAFVPIGTSMLLTMIVSTFVILSRLKSIYG